MCCVGPLVKLYTGPQLSQSLSVHTHTLAGPHFGSCVYMDMAGHKNEVVTLPGLDQDAVIHYDAAGKGDWQYAHLLRKRTFTR